MNKHEDSTTKEQNIIARLLDQVKKVTEGKPCVFRGENKHYGKIACTLYREQKKTIEENKEDTSILEKLNFPEIEKEIKKQAQSHFPDNTSNLEILTELQHYGGKTTLIDFTHNILIALFFACNGEPKSKGRIICLATEKTKKTKNLYDASTNEETLLLATEKLYDEEDKNKYKSKSNEMLLLSPKSKSPRVIFQSSVFVHAPKGYLEKKEVEGNIIDIKSGEKQAYLDALKRYHGIDATTVFNDLQGFIANKDTYTTAQTYFYIGVSYSFNNQHEKAIENYNKAIKLKSDFADAYYNRGIAKRALGNHEEAIQDYDKAIQLQPNFALAYNNRGNAKAGLGNHEEAIQDYDKAIQLQPNFAEAYNNRGIAKADLDRNYAEAIRDFTQAIRLDQDYADAYYNRGTAKVALGNHEEALKDYDTAIRLNSDHAKAYYNRGVVKYELGRYEEAIQDYDKAIQLQPNFAKAYNNRGNAKARLGNHEEAIKDYNTAIKINPNYADAYYNRGNTYQALGNHEEAIKDYNTAIKINPNFELAYYNRGHEHEALGDRAQKQGDTQASEQYYTKALQDYQTAQEKAQNPHTKDWVQARCIAYMVESMIQTVQEKLKHLRAQDTKQ